MKRGRDRRREEHIRRPVKDVDRKEKKRGDAPRPGKGWEVK